jgi:hypothetical protein
MAFFHGIDPGGCCWAGFVTVAGDDVKPKTKAKEQAANPKKGINSTLPREL